MAGAKLTSRTWIQEILPDEVRLRCSYKRRGKRILLYKVQVEIKHGGRWKPVVRYDNAHGFCHRDILHPDGTQDKTPTFVGDANATFTLAIKEAIANWEAQRTRFLGEIKA
jgi:hypothetical protein